MLAFVLGRRVSRRWVKFFGRSGDICVLEGRTPWWSQLKREVCWDRPHQPGTGFKVLGLGLRHMHTRQNVVEELKQTREESLDLGYGKQERSL